MKTININGQLLDFSTPRVMGIVNVTPDSFFSGSRTEAANEIIKRCGQILREGGTFIDVGAQSTSPASRFLDAKEEAGRLMPALKLIRQEFPEALLSVDTDRKSTRLNSSHVRISYAVFCLKKKKQKKKSHNTT